jgi:glucosamine kinase
MKLVADSGSTKTAWRLIEDNGQIHQVYTQGFNPFFQEEQDIVRIMKEEFFHQLPENLEIKNPEIYFYGGGCSTDAKKKLVEGALLELFTNAKIEVEHDLLAAARAACGKKPGMAAILGTGSNTCWYDGQKIVQNVASLGFILGDEGSGAHIGKTFIADFLNKEVPENIAKSFENRYKLGKEEILEAIYKKPFPNRFLAQFAKFVYQNLKDPYMVSLVSGCFNSFFDKHICKYPVHKSLKLGVVGSVGFYFSNILKRVADSKGVEIDTVIESPIAGLALYHLDNH